MSYRDQLPQLCKVKSLQKKVPLYIQIIYVKSVSMYVSVSIFIYTYIYIYPYLYLYLYLWCVCITHILEVYTQTYTYMSIYRSIDQSIYLSIP